MTPDIHSNKPYPECPDAFDVESFAIARVLAEGEAANVTYIGAYTLPQSSPDQYGTLTIVYSPVQQARTHICYYHKIDSTVQSAGILFQAGQEPQYMPEMNKLTFDYTGEHDQNSNNESVTPLQLASFKTLLYEAVPQTRRPRRNTTK